MTITVVAAIIRRNGRILITRRLDDVHLPGLWEFPGGKVEANETLHAALEREIFEELGVQIRVLEKVLTVEHEYPSKSVLLHFFNCAIVSGEPQPMEVADMLWVEPADLLQYPFPPADADLIATLCAGGYFIT